MIDAIVELLEASGWRVYRSGDVPNSPRYPYLLVYSLQPVAVRSLGRAENARRFRFGVTVVDLGTRFIEGDADRVERVLEGSRALGASTRVEWVARGPVTRDAEMTSDGQEVHTLPIHFTGTVPREAA